MDTFLTEKGFTQAQSIGIRLSKHMDDKSKYKFISSPLIRAKHTLQLIMEILGVDYREVIEDSRLRSKNKGDFENLTSEEIIEKFPEELDMKGKDSWDWAYPNGGESRHDEYNRVFDFFNEYKSQDNLVICAHEGVCCILIQLLENASEKEIKETKKCNNLDQNHFYMYTIEKGLERL